MKPDTNLSRRRRTSPVWWVASLLFHALLLGWLIFFSPVRVIDLNSRQANPAAHASPARAAEVMEEVRERQAATLTDEVRALSETRRELEKLEADKRAELRLATDKPAASPETIAAAQESVTQAQLAAAEALEKANEQLPTAQADLSTLAEISTAIREAQTRAGKFQGDALESLALADPRFEPAYQAQARANDAQTRANQTQVRAEGKLADATALQTGNGPKGGELEKARESLRTAESQLAAALIASESLTASMPQLENDAAAAQTAMEAALPGNDKAQVSTAKKRASETRKSLANARKNLVRAQSDIPKYQQRIPEQKERVAKLSDVPDANPEAVMREATENLREAQRLQAEALDAQKQAAKAFSDARSGAVAAAPPTSASPTDLAGVYKEAVQTEAELTQTYQRLRAAQLAMERQIPLAQALELTMSARSARPDLSALLSSSQSNGADAESQRQAVLDARSQIAAMRSLADSMLGQARGLGPGTGQHAALAQLAAEDEGQRAKDMTGVMSGGSGSNKGIAGSASGSPGSGSGTAGSGSGTAGSGSGAAGSSGTGTGSGTSGSGSGADGSGSGTAGSGGIGTGSGLPGGGEGSGSGPPPVQKDLVAVPGRVIGTGAVPGRWMFVDSWYLLGPFDNAGRANIEKQFPPETVVDLNATYTGKRGRPISWEFCQSAQPEVVPPFDGFNPLPSGDTTSTHSFRVRDLDYIIYYAYTEIRAVEECEVWITVGSDDFSKLWIEDQLVWASGTKLKPWRVDEGFRKVRLKKGVNRVLFRVENGHSRTEFSLAICGQ